MRAPLVVGIVVAAHCVAVGAVMLIQGCGTTQTAVVPPPEPVMPPSMPVVREPVAAPARVVETPKRAPKSWPAETTTYVVGKGDSLSAIAHRFDLSVAEIAALNGIKNVNTIRVGQKLTLPGKVNVAAAKAPAPAARAAKKAAVELPPGGNVYVVKAGDSLSLIASRTGVKTDAIRQANKLSNDKIYVGQKLVLPGAKKDAAPAAPAASASPDKASPPIPAIDLDTEPVTSVPPATPAAPKPAVGAPAATPAPSVLTPPAPSSAPAPAPAAGARTHTVEQGEDLYSVAMMYGISVRKLEEVNGLKDTELKPGQVLKIPIEE